MIINLYAMEFTFDQCKNFTTPINVLDNNNTITQTTLMAFYEKSITYYIHTLFLAIILSIILYALLNLLITKVILDNSFSNLWIYQLILFTVIFAIIGLLILEYNFSSFYILRSNICINITFIIFLLICLGLYTDKIEFPFIYIYNDEPGTDFTTVNKMNTNINKMCIWIYLIIFIIMRFICFDIDYKYDNLSILLNVLGSKAILNKSDLISILKLLSNGVGIYNENNIDSDNPIINMYYYLFIMINRDFDVSTAMHIIINRVIPDSDVQSIFLDILNNNDDKISSQFNLKLNLYDYKKITNYIKFIGIINDLLINNKNELYNICLKKIKDVYQDYRKKTINRKEFRNELVDILVNSLSDKYQDITVSDNELILVISVIIFNNKSLQTQLHKLDQYLPSINNELNLLFINDIYKNNRKKNNDEYFQFYCFYLYLRKYFEIATNMNTSTFSMNDAKKLAQNLLQFTNNKDQYYKLETILKQI